MLNFSQPEQGRGGFPKLVVRSFPAPAKKGNTMDDRLLDLFEDMLIMAIMTALLLILPLHIAMSSMRGLPQPAEYTVEVER